VEYISKTENNMKFVFKKNFTSILNILFFKYIEKQKNKIVVNHNTKGISFIKPKSELLLT
jgi:hypothetical protein